MSSSSPSGRTREPLPLRTLGLVAFGAAIGALARHAVGTVGGTWPAVFAINLAGAVLLGWLTPSPDQRDPAPWWLPATTTGFCGGFTTFSTVMVFTAADPRTGLGWLAAMMLATVAAAYAGWLMRGPGAGR